MFYKLILYLYKTTPAGKHTCPGELRLRCCVSASCLKISASVAVHDGAPSKAPRRGIPKTLRTPMGWEVIRFAFLSFRLLVFFNHHHLSAPLPTNTIRVAHHTCMMGCMVCCVAFPPLGDTDDMHAPSTYRSWESWSTSRRKGTTP